MDSYEIKNKEMNNINNLVFSKMNNGNILFHYHSKTRIKKPERSYWKKDVIIKIFNQKLEVIYEHQLKNFKNFLCLKDVNEIFELSDGNMIYNAEYTIYIIKIILKEKKILILQTIEIGDYEIFKIRELKNNDLLFFNNKLIKIYKKSENEYIKNYEIFFGEKIINCIPINKRIISILKNISGKGKVIFYNLCLKQIILVYEENNEEILSFIKLKNNPNFLVVSSQTRMILFDIKKFKIIQILNKNIKFINKNGHINYNLDFEISYRAQIFELDDGSVLIKEKYSNQIEIIIVARYKIENNLLKEIFFNKLDYCKFIIPFNNEIIGCYSGIDVKFFKIGNKKSNIQLNKKYKSLKELLK